MPTSARGADGTGVPVFLTSLSTYPRGDEGIAPYKCLASVHTAKILCRHYAAGILFLLLKQV